VFQRYFLLTCVGLAAYCQTPVEPINPGATVSGQIAGGETRSYSFSLEQGQFVRITAAKKGSDFRLKLFGPAGLAVDSYSLSGPNGRERIDWIGRRAGIHRIDLVSSPNTRAGEYQIRIEPTTAAGPQEQARVQAQFLFLQGEYLRHQKKLQEAQQKAEQARDAYRALNDQDGLCSSLMSLAAIFEAVPDPDRHIAALTEVAGIRHAQGDKGSEIVVLNKIGIAHLHAAAKGALVGGGGDESGSQQADPGTDDLDTHQNKLAARQLESARKAKSYFQQVAALAQETNDRVMLMYAVYNRARATEVSRDFSGAIPDFEQTVQLSREVKLRALEGLYLRELARALTASGHVDDGARTMEESIALLKSLDDTTGQLQCFSTLQEALTIAGRFSMALGYAARGAAVAKDKGLGPWESFFLKRQGHIYQFLSRFDNSAAMYEAALAIDEPAKETRGMATDLLNLSRCYGALHQPRRADEALTRAVGIAESIGAVDLQQNISYEAAWVAIRAGKLDDALRFAQSAIDLFTKLNRQDVGLADNCYTMSVILTRQGKYAEAAQYAQRGLVVARRFNSPQRAGWALSSLMFASAPENRRLAILYGKEAVNNYQTVRSNLADLDEASKASYLGSVTPVYRKLADLLIAEKRLPEAQQVLSLLKREEFSQFVRRDSGGLPMASAPVPLTAAEADSHSKLDEADHDLVAKGTRREQLMSKSKLTDAEKTELDAIEKDLASGNQQFGKVLDSLRTSFAAKPEAVRVDQITRSEGLMADLRDLGSGIVAIYTLVSDDAYRAILVTPDAQKAYSSPVPAAKLNEKVIAFRQALQNPSVNPIPLARELYGILIGPELEKDLKAANAQTIMWSLDGALRYVPMAALHDGTGYLVQKYRMAVFTPESLPRLKDVPQKVWTGAGFGVTKAHEGFAALPAVEQELGGIGKTIRTDVKLDENFTAQSMRGALRGSAPVVHVASHFQFQSGDDRNSYLLLGDGSHLTVADMKTIPSFGSIDLLTLSACNTGTAEMDGHAGEFEGFGMLAQSKGAKAVMATLWSVSDDSTGVLMREFYRLREANSLPKGEALRQAQIEMIEGKVTADSAASQERGARPAGSAASAEPPPSGYRHPFFWAPFILIGNWK
jgi:CHAT domain-containing protein